MNGAMARMLAVLLFCLAGVQSASGEGTPSPSADVAVTSWSSLIPSEAQDFEDPFLALEENQLYLLGQIARLRDHGISANDGSDQAIRLGELEEEAGAADLDVDYFLSKRAEIAELRRHAATAPNTELGGQRLSLAGFAVPGRPTADGNATFYLVPERGMCSHTPPPHPNQMVRIIVGADDAPQYLHQPVGVSGPIEVERSAEKQYILDGLVTMDAAYSMTADSIELIGKGAGSDSAGGTPDSAEDWTNRLRARWRAAQ